MSGPRLRGGNFVRCGAGHTHVQVAHAVRCDEVRAATKRAEDARWTVLECPCGLVYDAFQPSDAERKAPKCEACRKRDQEERDTDEYRVGDLGDA